jgi:hypothetical protein
VTLAPQVLENEPDRCLLLLFVVVLQCVAHDKIVLEAQKLHEPDGKVERGPVREKWNHLNVHHGKVVVLEGFVLQLEHFGR